MNAQSTMHSKLGMSIRPCIVAGPLLAAAVAIGCSRPADLGPVVNVREAANIREVLSKGAGEGTGGAAAATGTGWATLKGVFTYAVEGPEMPPFNVDKDQAVCAPGGMAPSQQFLLVDKSTKGIANIVIFPRRVARVHESAQPSDKPLVFDQKVCVFLTHVLPFTVGQPITIKNSDPVGHNTNIEGQGANKFNQTIPVGGSAPYVAKKEEATPVSVRCSIHPWMLAYMMPRSNGYFAATAEDGTFEIANLPAGEPLEIQFWHESAAGSNRSLVIDSPEAKELKWDKKGRIKITLEPDEVREIKIVVPQSSFALP